MKTAAILAMLLVAPASMAELGDTLYVQKPAVNVRTGPGTKHPIVVKLRQGHELVEFSRKGSWINVGIPRSGGKDGWIHASLVGTTSRGGSTAAQRSAGFEAFAREVEKLNASVRPLIGFSFFTNVEDLGDGIVQLTAHDQWVAAPRADRLGNLTTLMDLWSKHDGSGMPTAVYIVDTKGKVVMKESRP